MFSFEIFEKRFRFFNYLKVSIMYYFSLTKDLDSLKYYIRDEVKKVYLKYINEKSNIFP